MNTRWHQSMWKNKLPIALPKRLPESHKGDYGRVLIIAGSSGMTGAAILAGRAALRSGAGLTYLAVPKKLIDLVDLATPEIITRSFDDISAIKANSWVIGPGLGVTSKTQALITKLLTAQNPLVSTILIDADGLNIIVKKISLLKQAKAKVIITPHPGELARLINKSVSYVQSNRRKVAKEFAHDHKCIVVLKGTGTIVADPCGEVYINQTGNPGLATAGTGDVLSGMIGAFCAQGLVPFEAAILGVYSHGLAGDLAAREKGEIGLIASDVVEKIPYALRKVS
ncbi:NAD(P)H-hydrate dehydratase [Candidatus Saganbacteria bacterium CG08_land_8_20_14_0_20_45_16]|uniref:ADP-dependent (S)-NAD(P)H-hydrate dehydratase n=1 Tax=Candidatus Saganbacteria bacterium CG08_land_8_20_14_0_20_45_16 TaxID=2014293 RepID=A0A2H0XY33_UNCSA|nr:MAG: NAD(P)H-hydrate dehydratase [Candidatus Saganbacteria bacterium CG08_land_8_20_14_0_20_45_16]